MFTTAPNAARCSESFINPSFNVHGPCATPRKTNTAVQMWIDRMLPAAYLQNNPIASGGIPDYDAEKPVII
jgi:hypothetical protein